MLIIVRRDSYLRLDSKQIQLSLLKIRLHIFSEYNFTEYNERNIDNCIPKYFLKLNIINKLNIL